MHGAANKYMFKVNNSDIGFEQIATLDLKNKFAQS